jgi:hypothetical protein
MNQLKAIAEKANEEIGEDVFTLLNGDKIINSDNNFEGNDLELTQENGFFALSFSGGRTAFASTGEAISGLIYYYNQNQI